jgi:hypothetical protein
LRSRRYARVAGFQVGMDLNDVDHVNVEPALIEDNDVGIRTTRGGYQIFWNTFRNNGIALEVCGLSVCDIVPWHDMRVDGVRHPSYKVPSSRVRNCRPIS